MTNQLTNKPKPAFAAKKKRARYMIRICVLELTYVVFLCFLRRNSRIANILKTKLAVFFIYKGVVIRLMNFLEGSHFEKFFVCDSVHEIKSYRSVLYVPHCSKKRFHLL